MTERLPEHDDRRLPPHARGMRIGLLGGSFNPPHAAHRQISLLALKRLRLDQVWWLVTPGNPLKDTSDLPALAERMAAARQVSGHPRLVISGIEAAIGTSYTYATLAWLKLRCPDVHFVWIMGTDNLATFHRWQKWRGIADMVPMAVIDRGGVGLDALSSRAALTLSSYRWPEEAASGLPTAPAPAWVMLHGPKSSLSSTELRRIQAGGG